MSFLFLKLLRKLCRSFYKYEIILIEKIIQFKFEKYQKKIKFKENLINFNKINNNFNKKKLPSHMEIVICFFFRKERIKNLKKIINKIKLFNFKTNISIVTNNISKKDLSIIKKRIKNVKILVIKDIPEQNLLPWYCFDHLKRKYINKKISHFLYLEDDILINEMNIHYWLSFREILKKYKLIPGFIRYEKKNNKFYAVDYLSQITLKNTPKFYFRYKQSGVFNTKFPYHAASLLDRNLMKEYSNNKQVNIDYGFHNKFLKLSYPIKELANIIIGFVNVPKYLYNRFFLPFYEVKKIPEYCLIQHLDNKYSKLQNRKFGKYEINKLII